ncbi:TM2 domain-containing protein CG10795 [Lingula anatina]|uniref:TM2 domain-containing protein CG10795 n=1 Tax=Lingula anatina TaxID=7574 RepID=A0A1S3KHW3_LINAN|nr:TM2 domain-containing protein CG10795 [Lingula anatina]|eukprot:XP_013421816.1 TM2 domain-containing protein CG10795 [Lingula anatina]
MNTHSAVLWWYVLVTLALPGSLCTKHCSDLLKGQYKCKEPEIDPDTQQARGCTKENQLIDVSCMPAPDIECEGCIDETCTSNAVMRHNGSTVGFKMKVPCKWTNGYSFEVSLLLSIFLGMFGIDRFYLGYPAIGLLKFCTLGFMFIGQLIDIILIAAQVVGPSDGSHYVIDYYGAGLTRVVTDNWTVNVTE